MILPPGIPPVLSVPHPKAGLQGPAPPVVDGNVLIWDGTTGRRVRSGSAPASGDVVGPTNSLDNEVAIFSGASGKILKRPSPSILQSQLITTRITQLDLGLAVARNMFTTPQLIVAGVAGRILMPLAWGYSSELTGLGLDDPLLNVKWVGQSNAALGLWNPSINTRWSSNFGKSQIGNTLTAVEVGAGLGLTGSIRDAGLELFLNFNAGGAGLAGNIRVTLLYAEKVSLF